MMFKNIDIIAELAQERDKKQKQGADLFLTQIEDVLAKEAKQDDDLSIRLSGSSAIGSSLNLEQLGMLDADLVFSESVISEIATKFRLRFLNSKLYAGDIPYEANIKIKALEQKINHEFEQFTILAPSVRFKLKDATEDPILFADLGNGEYYMIHKWGDDMGWFRGILNFPMRSISTLALSSVSIGLLITLFLPESIFPTTSWNSAFTIGLSRIYLSFIFSGLVFVSALIIGILRSKEFSEDVWNSKYFN